MLLLFIYLVCIHNMCVNIHAMMHVWLLDDNYTELIFSFNLCKDSGDQTELSHWPSFCFILNNISTTSLHLLLPLPLLPRNILVKSGLMPCGYLKCKIKRRVIMKPLWSITIEKEFIICSGGGCCGESLTASPCPSQLSFVEQLLHL